MRNEDEAPKVIQDAIEAGDVETWYRWASTALLMPSDFEQARTLFHLTRLNSKASVRARKESRQFLIDAKVDWGGGPPPIDAAEIISAMTTGKRVYGTEKDLVKLTGVVVLIYDSQYTMLKSFKQIAGQLGKNLDHAGTSIVFRVIATTAGDKFIFSLTEEDPRELIESLGTEPFTYRIFSA